MTWTRSLCLPALLLSLAACGATPPTHLLPTGAPGQRTSVPGEYIVTAKSGAGADAVAHAYSGFTIEQIRPLGRDRFLIRFAPDPGIERVRRVGVHSGRIEAVQPNFVYRTR